MKKIKKIITLMFLFATSVTYAQFSNTGGGRNISKSSEDYNKVSFRLQVGTNISSVNMYAMDYDFFVDDNKPLIGVNVGFRVDKQFNRYFAFQTGLDYSLKGGKASYYYSYSDVIYECDGKNKLSMHYIQIPILVGARYDFNGKVPVQLQFNTGPYVAVAVAGKLKDNYSEYYESYDYSNGTYEYEYSDREDKYNAFGNIEKEDEVLGLKRFDMGWRFDLGVDINKFYLGLAYDLGFFDFQNEDVKKENKEYYGKNAYIPLKNGTFSVNIGCRF